MASRLLQVLLRVALLTALAASTALYIDYAREAPAFCGGVSGCAAVKASALSHVHGVGLPAIGLGAFAVLFGAAVLAAPLLKRWLLAAVIAAGVAGLGLIAAQLFVVHAICPWCVAADGSAAVAAVCALALWRRPLGAEPWSLRLAWIVAGAAAVYTPVSWAGTPVATVALPARILELEQPGRVNIVGFTDFECPYCRRLHHATHARIAEAPGKFHVVRLMAPLKMHEGAEPAARAYVCTPEAQREAAAEKLYDAKPETLTKDGMMAMAGELGLDGQAFARCYDDAATTAAIEADKALFQSLHLEGLPSTFIDDKLVLGADVRAFEQAVGGRDLRWMFALLGLVFAAVAAMSLFAGGLPEPAAKVAPSPG